MRRLLTAAISIVLMVINVTPVTQVEVPANSVDDFSYFEQEDYYMDIDGDGITETLSNITCGGDGHSELYIFKTEKGVEKVGYVDWLQLDLPVWFWGCNAVQTRYNQDQKNIEIKYCPNNKDAQHHKTTYANFDIIKYEEYDGEYLPGIDIEEAYERYGELNEH